jgi:endonuclease YncB( thermonuclease family)
MERKLSKIYTLNNSIFCILLLMLVSIFLTCTAEESLPDKINSSLSEPVKIIDGDSLEIGDTRIRLMGIDAPEYSQYCKNKNKKSYPCGKEATQYLQNLIDDTPVSCHVIKKDQYDRYLCTCYAKEKDLNREMILSGYAIVYLESPYNAEQKTAKELKRGLWQGRFMQPRLYRRLKEQEQINLKI